MLCDTSELALSPTRCWAFWGASDFTCGCRIRRLWRSVSAADLSLKLAGVAIAYFRRAKAASEPCVVFVGMAATSGVRSWNATSSGARDNETTQTMKNAATEYSAGIQIRVALERLTSRI